MKKIGIDSRLYSQTGVGTYLKNLIHYLTRFNSEGFKFYLYLLPEDKGKINTLPSNFVIKDAPYRWHSFSEQIRFLHSLNRENLDLMHFTYFGYPVLYNGQFVATVHDITPLLFKTGKASTRNPLLYEIKHFFFQHILHSQIMNSKAIITPTRTVSKQLIRHFGAQIGTKIHTIYEGMGYELMEAKENKALKTLYPSPFLIYVGNFYPHKNVERMVKAFADTKVSEKLILVGPRDFFSTSICRFIRETKVKNRIIFHEAATAEDLVFFYRNARGLIHPSLSEGFGLPLIEAAYFNCPIIASDIPVIKELLGNCYISFDPYRQDDIREKIEAFLKGNNNIDYVDLLSKYSFNRMSKDTFSLYKDILNTN